MHDIFWMVIGHSGTCYRGTSAPTVMRGIFWMVIGHSLVHATVLLGPHGTARYFSDGNRPLWYILLRCSATTVIYGIYIYIPVYIFGGVTPACLWCCDASKLFTKHENRQTSNLIFFPFILDVKFIGSTSRGHTGFLIHLPSAVCAFIFLARRVQPFLSLVDREVKFMYQRSNRSPLVGHFFFFFIVRKISCYWDSNLRPNVSEGYKVTN